MTLIRNVFGQGHKTPIVVTGVIATEEGRKLQGVGRDDIVVPLNDPVGDRLVLLLLSTRHLTSSKQAPTIDVLIYNASYLFK